MRGVFTRFAGMRFGDGPRHEIEKKMKEGIAFRLAGLREVGQAIPAPHTFSTHIDLPAEKF